VDPSELELYTTQELVAELMSRKTFLGIVVHAEQAFKEEQWAGEGIFKVHYNANLETAEAGRLLEVVAQHVDRQAD